MMATTKSRDLVLYRRLLRLAKPFWLHIAGFGLLSLLAIPLALLTPLPLKIAVDSGIGSRPLPRLLSVFSPATPSHTSALLLAVGLLVVVAIASQLQGLAVSLLRTYAGERLLLALRSEIFRHVQRLSLLFHDTRDRKSTRLNSSHTVISYAVFCLKKKMNSSNLFLRLILHRGNLFLIVQLHFSKLFLILKSGVNHTSRGSISTSTLSSIKLRKCSNKIITSILSFISGRIATKSNQIKQLIRNGRSASLQRTFKKSFTFFF